MPETRSSDYDAFAWFYNRYWGSGPTAFAARVVPILERLFLPEVPPGGHLLDLCCGSGQLAAELLRRSYRVTGVDGSEELLRFARENAPGAEFVHADARSFHLPAIYDGALSTYDSLNHLLHFDELTAAFRHARAALKGGAPFLLDLNMDEGYRARWRGSFGLAESDHALLAISSYDPNSGQAQIAITMFRLNDGRWDRADVTLHQRRYSEEEVRAALQAAGFTSIATHDAEKDLGLVTRSGRADVGRTFFLARAG